MKGRQPDWFTPTGGVDSRLSRFQRGIVGSQAELPRNQAEAQEGLFRMIRRNLQRSLGVGIMVLMTACNSPGGTEAGDSGFSDDVASPTKPTVMLGVRMGPPGEPLAQMLDVDPDKTTIINHVVADTPAMRDGLRQWDLVVAVNGEENASPAAIREVLANSVPGESIEFEVLRGGKRQKKIKVVLAQADLTRMTPESATNERR